MARSGGEVVGAPSHDGGQAGAGHVGDETHGGGDLTVDGTGLGVICCGEARGNAMAMSQDSSRVTDRAAASTSSGARPGARVVTVMMVR